MFSKIDTAGTGSVTEVQFAEGLQSNAPPPPPLADASSSCDDSTASADSTSSTSTTSSDSSSTEKERLAVLEKMLRAIESYSQQSASSTTATSVATSFRVAYKVAPSSFGKHPQSLRLKY